MFLFRFLGASIPPAFQFHRQYPAIQLLPQHHQAFLFDIPDIFPVRCGYNSRNPIFFLSSRPRLYGNLLPGCSVLCVSRPLVSVLALLFLRDRLFELGCFRSACGACSVFAILEVFGAWCCCCLCLPVISTRAFYYLLSGYEKPWLVPSMHIRTG